MNPKYLYTIKWTQPYPTSNKYLQHLWELYEEVIERRLDNKEFAEAKLEIERIMKL